MQNILKRCKFEPISIWSPITLNIFLETNDQFAISKIECGNLTNPKNHAIQRYEVPRLIPAVSKKGQENRSGPCVSKPF